MGVPATREWVSALVSKSLRAATGGGDKPPKALSELTDVVVTSPSNDDALIWDEESQMWMNKTAPSGTEVEGNPTDPATAELKKIKIGEDIFSIPEGGSSDYIEYDEETETIKFKEISGGESKPAIHEYSLEEQIVGKWVDGRNIYERTYVFDTYKEYGGWATFVVDDIFTDYELKNGIVSCKAYPGDITLTNGSIIRIRGNILELYCAWGTTTDAITIQYTKKSERS